MDSRATPAAVGQLVSSARRRAGLTQRALAARAGTSQAAIARYESGRHVPDLRTLTRLVAACGLELSLDVRPANATGQRDARSGSESAVVHPVAVPDDVGDPAIAKACGIVELPERIRWSGPRRSYDLSDRQDRARVYEQVLREGTDDDVRRFIRLDELADLWDDLIVPAHVRDAWERKLQGQALEAQLMLTTLQTRVARLVAELPEAEDFALAGGAALIVQGIARDLDLFATAAAHVAEMLPALEHRLVEDGLSATVERLSDAFVRLTVTDGSSSTVVDLAWDYRMRPPVRTSLGKVIAEEELAADKTLALFGRAEARDFVDMHHLAERYGLERLCELAFEKDRGFTPAGLGEAMSRFDRLDPAEFDLPDLTLAQLRAEVARWRRTLSTMPPHSAPVKPAP